MLLYQRHNGTTRGGGNFPKRKNVFLLAWSPAKRRFERDTRYDRGGGKARRSRKSENPIKTLDVAEGLIDT